MRSRPVGILPRPRLAHETYGRFNLIWVGVTFLDQTHGQPMRAEHQMNARAVRELPKHGADSLHQRLNVQRVIIELPNGMFLWFPVRRTTDATPFFQATEGRSVRKVRIERQ